MRINATSVLEKYAKKLVHVNPLPLIVAFWLHSRAPPIVAFWQHYRVYA